jgi:hypothetical protein
VNVFRGDFIAMSYSTFCVTMPVHVGRFSLLLLVHVRVILDHIYCN